MQIDVEELLQYYKGLGAPRDQTALVSMLGQIQRSEGGIPAHIIGVLAQGLQVKESFLLAVIKRMPSLRLQDTHCLEICAGPNCSKAAALARYAQTLQTDSLQVKFVPCMRMCGKGPNIRYDGKLYHKADEALLKSLT